MSGKKPKYIYKKYTTQNPNGWKMPAGAYGKEYKNKKGGWCLVLILLVFILALLWKVINM